MLGAEGVLDAVLEYLEKTVPARCDVVAARLSAQYEQPVEIDPPVEYLATDVYDFDSISAYPVIVASMATQDMRYVEHEHGDDYGFVTDQPVRIHVLERSPSAKDVATAEVRRNRLMLVVTEALLLDPSLGGGAVRMASRRLSSAWHVYERDTAGRIISPGHLELAVQAQEQLASEPLSLPPTVTEVVVRPLSY